MNEPTPASSTLADAKHDELLNWALHQAAICAMALGLTLDAYRARAAVEWTRAEREAAARASVAPVDGT